MHRKPGNVLLLVLLCMLLSVLLYPVAFVSTLVENTAGWIAEWTLQAIDWLESVGD